MLLGVLLLALQATAPDSPTPAPSPTPQARFTLTTTGSNVFVDQSTIGPGIVPPEGVGFAHGSPISPMSPYDWFSSAPVTPGVAGVAQYALSGSYRFSGIKLEATLGL